MLSKRIFDKMITVVMTQKMIDDLKKIGKDEEATMSSTIRSLIRKEVEKRGISNE